MSAVPCEVLNKRGEECRTKVAGGWVRCPFHTWQGAVQFADEIAAGTADIPDDPPRHVLLGIGLAAADALIARRVDLDAFKRANHER